MGEKNGKVSNLLEDGWFFGNTLLSCSNSSKSMVRCNSDPCSSSSGTKEEALDSHHQELYTSKMSSSLFRTPSLPPCWGRDTKYGLEDEDKDGDEEDEARMGDLIRQAMPLPRHNIMPRPKKRLDRTPSLPPCRVRDGPTTNMTSNDGKHDVGVGRLSRRESIDSSMLMKEKGPIAEVSKLTRRASIDSSMLLPPKCNTSKGTKLSTSNSKNRPHRKMESSLATNSQAKLDMKLEKLDICKSEKSLSDLEVEELQGFKDLGFSFDNQEELSPTVTQILPALQRRASLDTSTNHVDDNIGKVRRPYLSESWQRPLHTPPVPKWSDPKASSNSDDMKAQIKFWARAVASNVRQEC